MVPQKAASVAFFTAVKYFEMLGALFLTSAWLAFDHYAPWVNFHAEASSFVGLGLLALGASLSPSIGSINKAPQAVVTLIAVVVGFVWVHWMLRVGIFVGDALLISLYFAGLAFAIMLSYQYASGDQTDIGLKWVFAPIAVAALLSAMVGLLQWLGWEGVLGPFVVSSEAGDRPMGNMGQPNQLATLSLIGIVSFTWALVRTYVLRWISVCCIVFLTLVLALTQSRAGIVSATITSLFMVWKAHTHPGRLAPKHFILWLMGFGALLLLVPAMNEIASRGSSRSVESLLIASDRFTIWGQALAAIAQAPWLGYGWSQTPAAQAVGSLTVSGAQLFTFSHNIVLDMLVWNGMPVGLAISGLCAWWFVSRLRSSAGPNAVYAMAALLPILVHSMVEFPFAYAYFVVAAGLLIGVVEADNVNLRVLQFSHWWLAIGLGVWICVGSVMVWDYFRAEAHYRVARLVNQGLEPMPLDFQPPSMQLLTQLDALLTANQTEPRRHMLPAELETMHLVLHRYHNREIHLNYILALGLNSNTPEAIRQLTILRAIYGNRSFIVAQFVLRNWEKTYPELALVQVPPGLNNLDVNRSASSKKL